MISRRMLLSAIAALCFAFNASDPAAAQSYPTRTIKMIVPFPPGGPIDVMARLVAERMSAGLGQSVIIENRPGAGATIGTKAVASAEPDGYTLLFGSSGSLAVSPALYPSADVDPVKSFAPIASVSSGALVLVVSPSVPAKTVQEFVAYAKANPGKLNYGSGVATPPHVAWGLFQAVTGTEIVFVPYKGAAPAITDLLGGQVHMIIDAPGVLLPHIQASRLRPLAVTSPARSPDLPEIPTMVEAGYPDFVMTFWTGVLAPAGTSPTIINRLNAVINESLRSPDMKASLARFRVEPMTSSAPDFARFVADEVRKWSAVVKSAGIKAD